MAHWHLKLHGSNESNDSINDGVEPVSIGRNRVVASTAIELCSIQKIDLYQADFESIVRKQSPQQWVHMKPEDNSAGV